MGSMPHDADRLELWPILTDDELEAIAPDYIWGAEMGDLSGALTICCPARATRRRMVLDLFDCER